MKTYSIAASIIIILIFGCTPKTSEKQDSDSTTVASTEEPDDNNTSDPNTLNIKGKDIWVRDYPNTGKVVMTLNEGDECKIISKGRYDVIRGKGNYWYQIELGNKTGWVFGSQTDKPSDDPEAFDRDLKVNVTPDILKDNNLWDLKSIDCQNLFENSFLEIEKTAKFEIQDGDTVYKKTVKNNGDHLIVGSFDNALTINETFIPGPSMEGLTSLICERGVGAAFNSGYEKSLIASQGKSGCSFISEIKGRLQNIYPLKNGRLLLISRYHIFDGGLQMERGFLWIGIYDPTGNAITNIQNLGFYNFHTMTNTNWEGDQVMVTGEFENSGNKISLTLTELYKTIDDEFKETGRYTINRFFQFNDQKNLFEEIQQEVRSN